MHLLMHTLDRTLLIIPCGPDGNTSGDHFSFEDFACLFPGLESLFIHWLFFAKDGPQLVGLKNSASRRNSVQLPATLTSVHIKALEIPSRITVNRDQEHAEQLHLLLRQLRSLRLDHFHLDVGSFLGVNIGHSPGLDQFLTATLGQSFVRDCCHQEGRMVVSGMRKLAGMRIYTDVQEC